MNRLISLCVCIIAIIASLFVPQISSVVILVFWALLLSYTIKDLNNRVTLFAFLIAFFTFLLGRFLVKSLTNVLPVDGFNEFIDFSNNTEQFIFRTIIISLCFIFIGYLYGERRRCKNASINQGYATEVRRLSKWLVYLTFFFNLAEVLERVYYAGSNGYFEYYVSFQQNMPYIVYKLASFFVFSVFVNLATLPSKKEAKPIIFLYLFSAFIQLLIGARGAIMYPLLIILIYCFIRTKITPDDPWITNRGKRIIVILAPLMCVFMSVVSILRNGDSASGLDFFDAIKTFFFKQGTSYQIIGFVYDQNSSIPEGQIYTIGRIFHIFDGSIIGEILGIDNHLVSQTAEFALKGDDLASFITYIYNPKIYLNGGGYGSCYIAEAYADLGWGGIIICNFFVGYLLARIPSWMNSNIWMTVISFFILYSFIRAPRGSAFGFLGDIFNINLVLIAIFIHIMAKKRMN